MKNWIKGGLIGGLIGLVILILMFFIPILGYLHTIIYFPVGLILFLLDIIGVYEFLPSANPEEGGGGVLFWNIIGIISYILLGALIGWLIGRKK